ncbi:MAG: hypothetical protein ACQESP_12150 [Candidatus Muiribacteriota bacterium]
MSKDIDKFIEKGMGRYKKAAYVLVNFGKETENRLQSILEKREEWGNFLPKQNARAKSTTYWSEYPLLNARLEGVLNNEEVKIMISVNWYQSEGDYPFYSVKIESKNDYRPLLEGFDWNSGFEFNQDALRFYPDPNDFDLERDFNILLDEFNRFLSDNKFT